jgi:hypothetical protein
MVPLFVKILCPALTGVYPCKAYRHIEDTVGHSYVDELFVSHAKDDRFGECEIM